MILGEGKGEGNYSRGGERRRERLQGRRKEKGNIQWEGKGQWID